MQRKSLDNAEQLEVFYQVRSDDGLSPEKSLTIDADDMSGISTRGASKHVTTLSFAIELSQVNAFARITDVVPRELHVHTAVDIVGSPKDEERRTHVFTCSRYQTANDEKLSMRFVPQQHVR